MNDSSNQPINASIGINLLNNTCVDEWLMMNRLPAQQCMCTLCQPHFIKCLCWNIPIHGFASAGSEGAV